MALNETIKPEDRLRELYNENNQNQHAILSYRDKIAQNNEEIGMLEKVIRDKHVDFQQVNPDKKNGILEGSRCFICGNTASVCCFWCSMTNTPASYCPTHRERHKQEHPEHKALFRIVSFPKKENPITHRRIPMTPEQELEALQARIAELKAQGVTI